MNKYGLIGYPLGQSFSKKYFSNKFETENIDAEYLNFEIDNINKFSNIIDENKDIVGLNVTIPYKEKVIQFIDKLDAEAEKIGAINTIKVIHNGGEKTTIGYNTDAYGFEESLKPFLKQHHTKALVLGTGGASKAVIYTLKKLGIEYKLVSRKKTDNNLTYEDITNEILLKHPLVINSTPLGMYPNIDDCPQLPYEAITNKHLFYDLIYNPKETVFLKKAKKYNATIVKGENMLIKQAEKAWTIWNF
jgi:shikimate dehydrogenase